METRLTGRGREPDDPVETLVVGDRERRQPELDRPVDELVGGRGTVQEREVRVAVELGVGLRRGRSTGHLGFPQAAIGGRPDHRTDVLFMEPRNRSRRPIGSTTGPMEPRPVGPKVRLVIHGRVGLSTPMHDLPQRGRERSAGRQPSSPSSSRPRSSSSRRSPPAPSLRPLRAPRTRVSSRGSRGSPRSTARSTATCPTGGSMPGPSTGSTTTSSRRSRSSDSGSRRTATSTRPGGATPPTCRTTRSR